MTISDPLGRENYVRLVCQGYLALKLPIPAEFWDEWETILAADKAAEEERAKDLPAVGPLDVWAVGDGGEFQLTAKGPASGGSIVMEAHNVPFSGLLTHIELRKARLSFLGSLLGKGALVASIPLHVNPMKAGDSVTVMLNGADVAAVLKALE